MNQKTLLLLALIFLVLAGLSWYFIKYGNKDYSELTKDRDFAVKNTEDISTIILNNRTGDSIHLQKKEGIWRLNGKHKVYPNALNNLMDAIGSIKMQSIPSSGYYKNIMEGFKGMGIHVSLFDESNELIKSYWVGGATQQEYGTYFLMDGYKQPYILEIPHFVGNVRERFDLSYKDWRDRSLFDIPSQFIEEVEVLYPYQNQNSFIIRKVENKLWLMDAEDHSMLPVNNQNLLKNYLELFSGIGVEGIQNEHPSRAEVEQMKPYCTIRVKTNQGSGIVECKFYPLEQDSMGNSKVISENNMVSATNFFRLHVVRNDGDFLLVQYPVVQPLLNSKYGFLGR